MNVNFTKIKADANRLNATDGLQMETAFNGNFDKIKENFIEQVQSISDVDQQSQGRDSDLQDQVDSLRNDLEGGGTIYEFADEDEMYQMIGNPSASRFYNPNYPEYVGDAEFIAALHSGDWFYLYDENAPDYWWSAATQSAVPYSVKSSFVAKYAISLLAANWDAGTKSQTIAIANIPDPTRINFGVPSPTTVANALAFGKAQMFVTAATATSVTVTCITVPTVDITAELQTF